MRADAEGQTALRLRQGAQRAEKLDRAAPGRFVTGMERQEAQREAKICGVLASFDGGWDDAERVQVCFHPDGVDAEFTAVWLEISWAAKFARVGHSDLLGSLMALGMDRSLFGDLMVEDGTAYLLAMPEAAKSLQDEWHEAGHTAIRVCLLDAPPQFTPPQGAQMRDTVASLRLDCVLAAGMSLSRARAAEIIRQGLVQRNHTPEERVDTLLEAGDLLSIRGFGRIRLTEIGGRTRKDRISIQLEVFKRERSS